MGGFWDTAKVLLCGRLRRLCLSSGLARGAVVNGPADYADAEELVWGRALAPTAVRAAPPGMADVMRHALADAAALVKGGVDGLMVENFGDVPFHKGTVDDPVTPDVPAALAVVSNTLRERFDLPIAINCLRNDGIAAMAAAVVAAARYVRINVFSGAYLTDQG